MYTTNYVDTLILPAEDCKAVAKVPDKTGTVAQMQFARLIEPYAVDSDTLSVEVMGRRRDVPKEEWADLRTEIFGKGQACLRASLLVKTYGWALHHDGQARVALIDPRSARFQVLMGDPDVVKVKGMRTRRA